MFVRLKKVCLFIAAAVAQLCALHNRYDGICHNVCSEPRSILTQKCLDCDLYRATNIAQKLSVINNYATLLCEGLTEF